MPVLCMGLFLRFSPEPHPTGASESQPAMPGGYFGRHGVTVTSCAASSTYGAPGFNPCEASTS
jgi:hypothetical protein